MNTLQIKRALERDTFTKKIFGGVFAADELPKVMNTFPCGFVANTDPSTEPGTHWVAFYFPSREKGEFFDSYGYPPEHYGLNPTKSRRGTSINYKVRGATCVDNTVFFTFIIKAGDIA